MEKSIQSRKAIAYLRTSSAANVGADKDSDKRQRAAIEACAKREKLQVVEEFYDAYASGAEGRKSYAEIDAQYNGRMNALLGSSAENLRRVAGDPTIDCLGIGESGFHEPYRQTICHDGRRPHVRRAVIAKST